MTCGRLTTCLSAQMEPKLINNGAGSIAYTSDAQSSWHNLASTQFRQAFVLFMVYAAGSVLWQVLAFKMPARRHLLVASVGYFLSCVASVWANYNVQVGTSWWVDAHIIVNDAQQLPMCVSSPPWHGKCGIIGLNQIVVLHQGRLFVHWLIALCAYSARS